MCQMPATTTASHSSNTQTNEGPLPTPKDIMKAKIEQLLQKAVDQAKETDAQSLVKRATVGTPDEKLFS
ncbi:hypothetical protein [Simkania sp.]|uniref:hypothetical protein n=1 Tax=Simkania sp. TaxID=34094 RepID=UPI003B5197B4